jgi:hypothetical protein
MRPAGFDTNRTSGAARPAHKFTRANDFMGLSALSRNFCGRNSYPMHSERIVHADRELRPAIAPSPRRRGAFGRSSPRVWLGQMLDMRFRL